MSEDYSRHIFDTYSLDTLSYQGLFTETKVLQKYCLENKLGKYTLHSIRHTYCSYLLHKGVSIYYISKRLGHRNIKTTMDVYSHLLDETKEIEKDRL